MNEGRFLKSVLQLLLIIALAIIATYPSYSIVEALEPPWQLSSGR